MLFDASRWIQCISCIPHILWKLRKNHKINRNYRNSHKGSKLMDNLLFYCSTLCTFCPISQLLFDQSLCKSFLAENDSFFNIFCDFLLFISIIVREKIKWQDCAEGLKKTEFCVLKNYPCLSYNLLCVREIGTAHVLGYEHPWKGPRIQWVTGFVASLK